MSTTRIALCCRGFLQSESVRNAGELMQLSQGPVRCARDLHGARD
jgi:hypothetical protein